MLKISISTDNASFEDYGKEVEVARILRSLADRLELEGLPEKGDSLPLMDFNGNRIGWAKS